MNFWKWLDWDFAWGDDDEADPGLKALRRVFWAISKGKYFAPLFFVYNGWAITHLWPTLPFGDLAQFPPSMPALVIRLSAEYAMVFVGAWLIEHLFD
jgi:hypothetical protein